MLLANFYASPLFLTALNLFQGTRRAGSPIWIPIVILILLLLLFLSAYFTSSGIERSEATAEAAEPAEVAVAPLAEAPEPVAEPLAPSEPVAPDDLKRIEGIGPKIERILNEAGISTFARLAGTEVSYLEKIVREDAGIRVAYPDTWPQQAQLAADGQWEALEKLQDALQGGRQIV